jgi:hypothetical protein
LGMFSPANQTENKGELVVIAAILENIENIENVLNKQFDAALFQFL